MATIQTTDRTFARIEDFQRLIGTERTRELHAAAGRIRERLAGGTLWHVNSTAAGGGVAEMLHVLLPLYRSLGVQVGWIVVDGDNRFFGITKRLGIALYGSSGDDGPLGSAERDAYLATLAGNTDEMRQVVRPQDILYLHDHQTAGLTDLLHGEVSAVYWRCHVGADESTPHSEEAWEFLTPILEPAHGLVFSVDRHVPPRWLAGRAAVIPPFISPFSAKNRALEQETISSCLVRCGLRRPERGVPVSGRQVEVVGERVPEPDDPLLVQVSRWDRLKDMHGVLASFAGSVDEGHLALVGPDPAGIQDDIEQAAWFGKCLTAWRSLPSARRQRVSLICLPMSNLMENALFVNAIQRAADVVLQKSLAEGFGLTVTEAMWKSRVVVASAVGGIRAQITPGVDGFVVGDPGDLQAFGALMADVVTGQVGTGGIGVRAHQTVLDRFLPDREVVSFARMLSDD